MIGGGGSGTDRKENCRMSVWLVTGSCALSCDDGLNWGGGRMEQSGEGSVWRVRLMCGG